MSWVRLKHKSLTMLFEYKNAEWAKRESEITDNNELSAFIDEELDAALESLKVDDVRVALQQRELDQAAVNEPHKH